MKKGLPAQELEYIEKLTPKSEVVREIVGDYYKGNLVRASELVPELLTALKKKRDEEEAEELRRKTTGTSKGVK